MILSAKKRIFLGGIIGTVIALGGAQAGTTLHFDRGSFSPQAIKQDAKSFSLGQDTAAQNTNFFVIQFKNRVSSELKQSLQSQGAEIHRYIPDDALLVSGNPAGLTEFAVAHRDQVNGVVPYLPSLKLSRDLEPMSRITAHLNTKVVVQAFKGVNAFEIEEQVLRIGAKVEAASGQFLVLSLQRGQIAEVAALDGVEHIQPYKEMKQMNMVLTDEGTISSDQMPAGDYSDLTGFETGTSLMNFRAAWEQGITGQGQRVGIADTGLDQGAIETLHSDFADVVYSGYNHGLYAKNWSDPVGHGTHVAGSVAGRGVASSNVLTGGAYQADLVIQGMWSPLMNNLTVPPQLGVMFSEAYEDGARIHTNSWGSARDLGAYDSFAQMVDEFMWENPEMLILFAAGNSGVDRNLDGRIDEGSISSPGTAKNTLTVGASENTQSLGGMQIPPGSLNPDNWGAEPIASGLMSDNADGLAMFSSRGPTRDGRTKPEIVAPGTNILSVKSQANGAGDMWGAYNKDYVYSGGTSMSTPLTAGAAALTRQFLIERMGQAAPSAALVKAVLMNRATEMYPGQYGEVGAEMGQEILTPRPNSDEGFGRVDMQNIVGLNNPSEVIDYKEGLLQEEAYTHNMFLASNSRVAVTLSYTDAPASPSAGKALVNDLDLVITGPNGEVHESLSRVDNFEHIEVNLPAGAYSIEVRAENVPQGREGRQDFALIVTSVNQ